jgi:hypothetical protein
MPLNTVVRPNGDDKPINTSSGDGYRHYRKSASRDDSWVDNNGREKTFPFIKATAYQSLGILVIKEGIPESTRNVLAHFWQYLDANEGIGYVEAIS